jgi:hypothetical protein
MIKPIKVMIHPRNLGVVLHVGMIFEFRIKLKSNKVCNLGPHSSLDGKSDKWKLKVIFSGGTDP